MANPITTYAVDSTAVVNIVANSWCKRILVQENYDSTSAPTADLLVYNPANSATPAKVAKGTPAIFTPAPVGPNWQMGCFYPGQIVGGIKTAAGSITVQQIEGEAV